MSWVGVWPLTPGWVQAWLRRLWQLTYPPWVAVSSSVKQGWHSFLCRVVSAWRLGVIVKYEDQSLLRSKSHEFSLLS